MWQEGGWGIPLAVSRRGEAAYDLGMYENALLTIEEMAKADASAVAGGMSSLALMENAGAAVARELRRRWPIQPVVVLAGPGNNGGDGFVVARLLKNMGWPVSVALLGDRAALKGDALANADRWAEKVLPLTPDVLDGHSLVVDAVFGAGLSRPLVGPSRATIEAIGIRGLKSVAVDIPSGVDGNTGAILGAAARADLTVTFFRRKPGHVLYPGRLFAGDVIVADIGIPDSALTDIKPKTFANGPDLWLGRFPWAGFAANKYERGHLVIVGGAEMTGAARLAAAGARRAGAGLVTIVAPKSTCAIYSAAAPGVIVKPLAPSAAGERAFRTFIADRRRNAILIGPGAGVTVATRRLVLAALKGGGKAVVLDADALTVFANAPAALFKAIRGPVLLTPHDGEFARLFPGRGDRLARARKAARQSGAVVLLKGPDTVIAAPDGRAAINENAAATLATAGSGDVLAGIAAGLMAGGMDAFDAGSAAAWMHGAAAEAFGLGLIAEDLADELPGVMRRLAAMPMP